MAINYTPANYTPYTPANANYTSAFTGLPAYAPPPRQRTLGARDSVQTQNVPQAPTNTGGGDSGGDSGRGEPSLDLSPYFGELDRMSGMVDVFGEEQKASVGTLAAEQTGQVEAEKERQLGRIEGYRGEARETKKTTLRDLSQDLINAMQAGQVYLGGIGAGASSAVGRMTGALSKAANKRSTDVFNQYNKIMSDINLKEEDVRTTVQQELSNIRQWKANKIAEVVQWVNSQKLQMQGMRADAQMMASQNALQQAYDRLNRIEQNTTNYSNALREWALSRSENLAQLKTNLQGVAQYQQPNVAYQPFSGRYRSTPGGGRYAPSAGTTEEELPLA